jgi:dihydroneopterin triphosphate diphosphatase
MPYKLPRSIQVVIFAREQGERKYLLLKRVFSEGGFWQTVTGSLEIGESHLAAAVREISEETGIVCRESDLINLELTNLFEIAPLWRPKFAPGVTHNEEVCFALPVVISDVRLDATEHDEYCWVVYESALPMLYWESSKKALMKTQELANRLFAGSNF